MAIYQEYRVLADAVSRDAFGAILRKEGFQKREEWAGEAPSKSFEQAWLSKDEMTAVNYIEDDFSDMRYVSIREKEGAESFSEFLEEHDLVFTPDELAETRLNGLSPNDAVDLLFRIAITFPEFDEDAFAILRDAAAGFPDENVRGAALEAIGMRAWPELKSTVETVARDDSSAKLRTHAAKVLARWPQ